MAIVLVVDTVDDPGENGLVHGLAVLPQSVQQDLLLERDRVEGKSTKFKTWTYFDI